MALTFNGRILDLLGELVAPQFVGHNPLSAEPIQGPEGLKGFFGGFRTAMPDINHPRSALITEGDLVAIRMPIEGTFTNPLMGIPPNGKKMCLGMCNVWKVVGGKAVEWWLNLTTSASCSSWA